MMRPRRTDDESVLLSRRQWIPVAGAATLFGGVVYGLTKGIRRITPTPPPRRPPGEPGYLRQVVILADQTASMNPAQCAAIRKTAQTRILDRLGPGDFAACYQIGDSPDGYDEVRNWIFGDWEEALPKVRPEYADRGRFEVHEAQELLDCWRKCDQLMQTWRGRVAALAAPGDHSCYLSALDFLETHFAAPEANERWLFILGDLVEDPEPSPFEPPAVSEGRGIAYESVKVVLVRPFQIRGRHPEATVSAFWTKYFSDRGAVTLDSYGLTGFPGLVPSAISRPQL